MKTILVATDFSPAALNAANYASDMALAIHAGLLLIHIYKIPVSISEIPMPVNLDDMAKDAETELAILKDLLVVRTGGKISIKTEVKMGAFFQELEAVCDRIQPYAAVMGSQGTTAAERLFFGGHTVYAMRHLEWPLITVPTAAKFSLVKKIGFACDFTQVVDIPVEEIKKLVSDFNAELHILNTGYKEEFSPEIIFESALLQEQLGTLKPKYDFITNNNIDDGIMDFAEKNKIDLLIVLPKRHSFMDRMVYRSHTKHLVLHCHVPVMALHQ